MEGRERSPAEQYLPEHLDPLPPSLPIKLLGNLCWKLCGEFTSQGPGILAAGKRSGASPDF